MTGFIDGGDVEVLAMLSASFKDVLEKRPHQRRAVRHMIRLVFRETRPESPFDYLLRDWPLTLLGAAVISAMVYAFSFVCHWLGVV